MWKVNIYIETSTAYQKTKERGFGFVLECRKRNGELETRDKFFKEEVTYHQATLMAVLAALKKLNTVCEIYIHTEDVHVASRINKLVELEAAEFKDVKGNNIKNQELWMQICSEAKECTITTRTEKHSYSNWMKREMEERKNEGKESQKGSETNKEIL